MRILSFIKQASIHPVILSVIISLALPLSAGAELENVVAQLENGALSLDETMTLYQRGRALAARPVR